MRPERDDYIYLAGIIDGEGCVSVTLPGYNPAVHLCVANASERIIQWLEDRWEGRRYFHQKSKTWSFYFSKRAALDVLTICEPHIVIKKEEVRAFREFYDPGRSIEQKVDDCITILEAHHSRSIRPRVTGKIYQELQSIKRDLTEP